MLWSEWWIWMAAGLVLGIVEITIPGFVFLGFAIGAIIIGLCLAIGVPLGGLYIMLVVFAVVSLVSWIALRRILGVREGQTKIIDRDINE